MTLNALAKFTFIDPFLRKEMNLSTIANTQNISLRTLQRWVMKYNKEGLQWLERKPRADKGVYSKASVELKELAEGLASLRYSRNALHRSQYRFYVNTY